MTEDTDRLIIGVDPGGTCGYAYLDADGCHLHDLPYETAVDWLDDMTEWARRTRTRCVISVERFTISGRRPMTSQPAALKYIGVAEYLARTRGHRFMLNGVSDAQSIGTNAVLRRLGWWKPGADHCNRAAAQVAYAYALLSPDEFERLTRV